MIRCLAALAVVANPSEPVVDRTLVLDGQCESWWPPGLREALDLELRPIGWRLLETGDARAAGVLWVDIVPCAPGNQVLEAGWTPAGRASRRTQVELTDVPPETRTRVAALRLAGWVSLPAPPGDDELRHLRPDAIAGELGATPPHPPRSAAEPDRPVAGDPAPGGPNTAPDWLLTSSVMSSLQFDPTSSSLGVGAVLSWAVGWRPIATTAGIGIAVSTAAPLGVRLTDVCADVELRSQLVRPLERVGIEAGGRLGLTYSWLTTSSFNPDLFLDSSRVQGRAALLARADLEFSSLGVVVEIAAGYRFSPHRLGVVYDAPVAPVEILPLQGHVFVALQTGVRWSIDL